MLVWNAIATISLIMNQKVFKWIMLKVSDLNISYYYTDLQCDAPYREHSTTFSYKLANQNVNSIHEYASLQS